MRQTLDDAGAVVGSVQYDPWGVPTAGTLQLFGFTGELHSAGQVYLRARWYAPGQGRFVSEDPFAGFAEMPYSLHAYQYGYSDPVVWTDPSGEFPCLACTVYWRVSNWNFNWTTVRMLKDEIISAAKDHERPSDGFPWEVMASLMGTHVAREKRTVMREYDALGDLLRKGEASTGIANIRPEVVVKTYYGDMEFPNEPSRPDTYRFTTIEQFHTCLNDNVLDEHDYKAIHTLLQSPIVSLDVLGANIERGIDRARLYRIEPSIFNIGNWIWNGNQDPVVIQEGIDAGLPADHQRKGYIHGLVMIQHMPTAATQLGITLPAYHKYSTSTDPDRDESRFIPDDLK